jgi:hypothetical protein
MPPRWLPGFAWRIATNRAMDRAISRATVHEHVSAPRAEAWRQASKDRPSERLQPASWELEQDERPGADG